MSRVQVFQALECGGPGGTGAQVAAICNHLDPARFEAALVYSVRPGCSAEEYRAQARGARKAFYVPEMTREISPALDLRAFWKLYRLFKTERPDVVHAHSSKAGALARPAALLAGVPRILYSPHGFSFQMEDRGILRRRAYREIERCLSRIGEIAAVSASEAGLARSIAPPGRVHVVWDAYLGDLPPEPEAKAKEAGLLIGACGRLTFARRPEAFVRLAQRVGDSRNGVRFVWIGDGELRPLVEELAADLNLKPRFELTGWLSPEEVRKRLSDLDVFVHFSRWEGLPNAVLEAMACGLPVVASDIPGNRDLVSPGVNGYLASSEVTLLERALELADDPELRRTMGRAGRRRVETEFTPARTIPVLERLYSG